MNSNFDDKILSLFSKNSPIHSLTECDENLSLFDRLRLFGFDDRERNVKSLLIRLLDVKSTSDKKLFTVDEVEYLERLNLQLDIPRVYFLTEKRNGSVMEKLISLGYYEEIPLERYNVRTMCIAAILGKVKAVTFLHENGCPWDRDTTAYASRGGHLSCLEYAHTHNCPWDRLTPMFAAKNGHLHCLQYAHEEKCPWDKRTFEYVVEQGHFSCL